jgi:hypothetical protein
MRCAPRPSARAPGAASEGPTAPALDLNKPHRRPGRRLCDRLGVQIVLLRFTVFRLWFRLPGAYRRPNCLPCWPCVLCNLLILLARETGLEPATSGVTGRRSNQLSYSPATLRRESRICTLPDRIGKSPSQARREWSTLEPRRPLCVQPYQNWWAVTGSNRRPSRCKRDALPAELTARGLPARGAKWWHIGSCASMPLRRKSRASTNAARLQDRVTAWRGCRRTEARFSTLCSRKNTICRSFPRSTRAT